MAKISIDLPRQEATAFTFGKDVNKQIKILQDRIAEDTAELNRLIAQRDGDKVSDVIKMLEKLGVKTTRGANLDDEKIVGVNNPLAEVEMGVPKRPAQGYAYTLLTKEEGKYAFAIIRQRMKLVNYGGRKPNARDYLHALYEKVFIPATDNKSIHHAFDVARKLALKLSGEKIHVDEQIVD